MITHWVLSYLGKWHAWPDKGRQTLCGRLNVEHLRQGAATKISDDTPAPGKAEKFCLYCARKAGISLSPPHADPCVGAWIGLLKIKLRHTHIRVADSVIEQLATLLAEVGPPGSFEGSEVFEQVQQLLLKPSWTRNKIASLPHLKAALALLAVTTGSLQRVADTVRAYRSITNRSLVLDNFHADRVIEIILQIPTPEPYIRHLNSRGLTHFAAMFHPNTLERARKDPTLRGLFAGSNEYWDRTTSQLNIVSD